MFTHTQKWNNPCVTVYINCLFSRIIHIFCLSLRHVIMRLFGYMLNIIVSRFHNVIKLVKVLSQLFIHVINYIWQLKLVFLINWKRYELIWSRSFNYFAKEFHVINRFTLESFSDFSLVSIGVIPRSYRTKLTRNGYSSVFFIINGRILSSHLFFYMYVLTIEFDIVLLAFSSLWPS